MPKKQKLKTDQLMITSLELSRYLNRLRYPHMTYPKGKKIPESVKIHLNKKITQLLRDLHLLLEEIDWKFCNEKTH